MKLDFVCIGAQKAGTTKLHEILSSDKKNFNFPNPKEAHFFDIDERFENGIEYFFKRFYNNYDNNKKTILINPNISIELEYINRILKVFPYVKILLILRNPLDRAFSHYKMSKFRGLENLSFLSAIQNEGDRLSNPDFYPKYKTSVSGHYEKNHFGYLYRGDYAKLVQYCNSNIKKENFKIIFFDEFINNMNDVVLDIYKFLNISRPSYKLNLSKSNQSTSSVIPSINSFIFNKTSKTNMSFSPKELKFFLKKFLTSINSYESKSKVKFDKPNFDKFFLPMILDLEKVLGIKLDKWKKIKDIIVESNISDKLEKIE